MVSAPDVVIQTEDRRSPAGRWSTMLVVVLLSVPAAGCGILMQTVVGWSSTESTRKSESTAVLVDSEPTGAQVTRVLPSEGTPKELGPAPLTDHLEYELETVTESPSAGGLLLGGALEAAAGVLMFLNMKSEDCTQVLRSDCSTEVKPGLLLGGLGLTYLGVQDLAIAFFYSLSGDQVKARRVVDPPKPKYTATLAGHAPATIMLSVPDQTRARLALTAVTPPPMLASASMMLPGAAVTDPPLRKAPPADGWVIAVMDIEDLNAGEPEQEVDPSLMRNLGDQLRVFVTQRGAKTIDRGTQDKVIKDQIATLKEESYKTCYDDSCQIELGKALAASHILRARIARFGARCVLNAELVDLRAEVTVAAASSRGVCEAEGFLTMSEEVAQNLVQ